MMTGTITVIKLAVRPSFLPDSSDMLLLILVSWVSFRRRKSRSTLGKLVGFNGFYLLVAYQATNTETTDNVKITVSNGYVWTTKGTRKSTNPMGKAIKNNRSM